MNKITKYVLGGGLVLCVVAGVTLATPTVGTAFNNILSTGTIDKDIDTRAHVALPGTAEPREEDERWRAKVETDGASNVIVQDIALLPGGYNRMAYASWHLAAHVDRRVGGVVRRKVRKARIQRRRLLDRKHAAARRTQRRLGQCTFCHHVSDCQRRAETH